MARGLCGRGRRLGRGRPRLLSLDRNARLDSLPPGTAARPQRSARLQSYDRVGLRHARLRRARCGASRAQLLRSLCNAGIRQDHRRHRIGTRAGLSAAQDRTPRRRRVLLSSEPRGRRRRTSRRHLRNGTARRGETGREARPSSALHVALGRALRALAHLHGAPDAHERRSRHLARLSPLRDRRRRQRRPLRSAQVASHGDRDRVARDARDASLRRHARHGGGLLQGARRRRDSVSLHDAFLDSERPSHRGLGPARHGLHGPAPRVVADRTRARRRAAFSPCDHHRDDRLVDARAPSARRNDEDHGARLRDRGAGLRRAARADSAPPRTPQRFAHRPHRDGPRLLGDRPLRGGAELRGRRGRSLDELLRHHDQRGAKRNEPLPHGLVESRREFCLHALARALGEPLCGGRARRL